MLDLPLGALFPVHFGNHFAQNRVNEVLKCQVEIFTLKEEVFFLKILHSICGPCYFTNRLRRRKTQFFQLRKLISDHSVLQIK